MVRPSGLTKFELVQFELLYSVAHSASELQVPPSEIGAFVLKNAR